MLVRFSTTSRWAGGLHWFDMCVGFPRKVRVSSVTIRHLLPEQSYEIQTRVRLTKSGDSHEDSADCFRDFRGDQRARDRYAPAI
jgi:hypothetical protein